jgi:hypothetical protein
MTKVVTSVMHKLPSFIWASMLVGVEMTMSIGPLMLRFLWLGLQHGWMVRKRCKRWDAVGARDSKELVTMGMPPSHLQCCTLQDMLHCQGQRTVVQLSRHSNG